MSGDENLGARLDHVMPAHDPDVGFVARLEQRLRDDVPLGLLSRTHRYRLDDDTVAASHTRLSGEELDAVRRRVDDLLGGNRERLWL
jgi:hypothetical protein